MTSALFLAAVLVIGGALVVAGAGRQTPDSGQPASSFAASLPATSGAVRPAGTTQVSAATAAPATTAGLPEAVAGESICGLLAGSQDIPAASSPAAQWQFVGGIAVPTSPLFGPGMTVDGVGGCFAHSPTGALFAMMTSIALTAVPADQVSAAAVVRQRGSRSNLYEQVLAQAEAEDTARATRMPSDPRTTPKVAFLGYRFVDYTPARATIAVAIGIGDPLASSAYRPGMLTAVLAWEGGDWMFVYSAETGSTMAPIISPQQYTPWAA